MMTLGFKFPTQGYIFASIPVTLALWHRHLVFQTRMTSFKEYNSGPLCITGMISPDYQGEVKLLLHNGSVQFNSVAQSYPTLCNPMNCSTRGLPLHHQLPEFTQTHVHWVGDAIQPSHPLSSPSPPALNLSQHQGLFQWVSSSHQVAKVLEFQLQHQSFQWTPRTDLL